LVKGEHFGVPGDRCTDSSNLLFAELVVRKAKLLQAPQPLPRGFSFITTSSLHSMGKSWGACSSFSLITTNSLHSLGKGWGACSCFSLQTTTSLHSLGKGWETCSSLTLCTTNSFHSLGKSWGACGSLTLKTTNSLHSLGKGWGTCKCFTLKITSSAKRRLEESGQQSPRTQEWTPLTKPHQHKPSGNLPLALQPAL